MAQTYANNASSTLASGYTAGDSTISVQSGDGAKFPATGSPVAFYLKCTSRSTDTLTVSVTGQEGTSAANKASGTAVTHVITAAALTAIVAQGVVASSGLVLLEQHTASSSAVLDFTTCITSVYDSYLIQFVNVIPATNGAIIYMRLSTDGGATYDTTAIYTIAAWLWINGSQAAVGGTNGYFPLTSGSEPTSNSSTYSINGDVKLSNPLSAVTYKHIAAEMGQLNSASQINGIALRGFYASATAVNAFRILFDSGNIASGTIRVYGYTK